MSARDPEREERSPGADYLVDKTGPADPEVARLERLLGRYRLDPAGRAPTSLAQGEGSYLVSPRVLRTTLAIAASFVAAMLSLRALRPGPSAWSVRGLPGVERIARGEWLDVPREAGPGVSIEAGDLGQVLLEPGARVRLDDEGRERHSLYLERGALRATIVARPREFEIGTPAGLSVDLGCMYDVDVDPSDGASTVRVLTGMVAFEAEGRTAFVPAGYETLALPGAGPAVPVLTGADPELVAWVRAVERAPSPPDAALARIASVSDDVVLYHLLRAPSRALREAALARLLAVEGDRAGPAPPDVLDDDRVWLAWHERVLGTAFQRR